MMQVNPFSTKTRRLAALVAVVGGAGALAASGGQAFANASTPGTAFAGGTVVGTTVRVPVSCEGPNYCNVQGDMYITVNSKRVDFSYGYDAIDVGKSGTLKVTLQPAGKKYLTEHSSFTGKLIVVSEGDPSGPTGATPTKQTTIETATVLIKAPAAKG